MPTGNEYLREAYLLALRGEGHTRPNPPVGAVVVRNGKIVGAGWHKRAGADHAEAMALKAAGEKARGATVYVTLEPCSRPGRVGACTDALAAAGVKRVVYGMRDPNPKNRGRAKRALAKAGIECERADSPPELAALLEDLITPFAKHVTTGLPYVTVKLAMSLDGKICDDYGDAKWISGDAMRKTTDKMLRQRADAIMVGAETVRRDNPSLLSHFKKNRDLVRVIVSRSGNLPEDAQIFTDGAPNETLVFSDGVEALKELGRRGMMHVVCEGGMKLAVSLAEAGLVDRWLTVLAPKVIGSRHIKDAILIKEFECLQDS